MAQLGHQLEIDLQQLSAQQRSLILQALAQQLGGTAGPAANGAADASHGQGHGASTEQLLAMAGMAFSIALLGAGHAQGAQGGQLPESPQPQPGGGGGAQPHGAADAAGGGNAAARGAKPSPTPAGRCGALLPPFSPRRGCAAAGPSHSAPAAHGGGGGWPSNEQAASPSANQRAPAHAGAAGHDCDGKAVAQHESRLADGLTLLSAIADMHADHSPDGAPSPSGAQQQQQAQTQQQQQQQAYHYGGGGGAQHPRAARTHASHSRECNGSFERDGQHMKDSITCESA
jgi:hypothetical protein